MQCNDTVKGNSGAMTTITPPRLEGLSAPSAELRPRDRILGTARDLFHKHGYRGVGVDAIAEAAGTNKMTLYRHFGSKDDLIVECLHGLADEADAIWAGIEEKYLGDPVAQLHAWVQVGADCAIADARGCDMVNAAVELTEPGHPARRVIEDFKTAQRDRLVRLCRVGRRHPGGAAGRHAVAAAGRRPGEPAERRRRGAQRPLHPHGRGDHRRLPAARDRRRS